MLIILCITVYLLLGTLCWLGYLSNAAINRHIDLGDVGYSLPVALLWPLFIIVLLCYAMIKLVMHKESSQL